MTRALRWDTWAHTMWLISAISGLTKTINGLTRGIEDGVQAVLRSLNPSVLRLERSTVDAWGGTGADLLKKNPVKNVCVLQPAHEKLLQITLLKIVTRITAGICAQCWAD